MKKTAIFIFLFFGYASIMFAQQLPEFKSINLRKKSQYKAAEPTVLRVIDYIFATPIDKKNKDRRNAGEFLLKWMNGTPDHIFLVEEKETNFFNSDADLVLVYMAALTKFKLLHSEITDQQQLVVGAMQIALPYLNTQEDKGTWNKELWQLNDANQKGKLISFLY